MQKFLFRFADSVSEGAVKINGGGGEEERANGGALANAFVRAGGRALREPFVQRVIDSLHWRRKRSVGQDSPYFALLPLPSPQAQWRRAVNWGSQTSASRIDLQNKQ